MDTSRRPRLLILLLLTVAMAGPCAFAGEPEVTGKIRQLLDSYARKDLDSVMAQFAEGNILVMGSDVDEVGTSREQATQLFRDDFKLWDSSSFGSLGQIYTEASDNFVSAFFDVPFTFRRGGVERTVVVRFATVWKKTPQGLKLLQSMNTTPTVGQSAKQLVAPRP